MNIIILRGGSGAGKSTWIKTNYPDAVIFSTDTFFMDADGIYRFDPTKLGEAHNQCLRNFIGLCQLPGPKFETATVIVDNTNSTISEFGPYAQVALVYGHSVEILTFIYDPVAAFERGAHGAPLKTCIDLHQRLTDNTKLIPPWWKHNYISSDRHGVHK